jgi:single stranded DNA-binding protein
MTQTSQTWIATGVIQSAPVLRTTGKGKAVCNFELAVRRTFFHQGSWQSETDLFPITCWDAQAQLAATYSAGALLFVRGYIKHRTWTDNQGQTHQGFEVVPSEIQVLTQGPTVNDQPQLHG